MLAISTPTLFATNTHTDSDLTCALNLPICKNVLSGTTLSWSQLADNAMRFVVH